MSKPVFPHVRIVVDLGGPDGNAFAAMGRVTAAMRDAKIDQSEIGDYLKARHGGRLRQSVEGERGDR